MSRRRGVYIENGSLILNKEYPYKIELEKLKTPEQVLFWCYHLGGKPWFDGLDCQKFISLATNHEHYIGGFSVFWEAAGK